MRLARRSASLSAFVLLLALVAGCVRDAPGDRDGGNAPQGDATAGAPGSGVDEAGSGTPAAPDIAARSVAYRTEVMGTWGTVTIVTPDSAAQAPVAAEALETWHHVDRLLSNWKETSELSRMNREAGADTVEVDAELAFVLGRALAVAAASDGAFDVTVEPLVRLWGFLGGTPHVPEAAQIEAILARTGWERIALDPPSRRVVFAHPELKVDLGGIAKGYGVDVAWAVLEEAGVAGMVDLSGNIRTLGTPAGRDAWLVGVRDPRDRVPFFAKLRLQDAAMATSGQYEQFVAKDGKQYGHILNPRTGWPAEGLLSATVLAPTAMDADAWATAFVVLGPERAREIAKARPDLAVVLIEDGGTGPDIVWVETELGERFQLVEGVTFVEVRTF